LSWGRTSLGPFSTARWTPLARRDASQPAEFTYGAVGARIISRPKRSTMATGNDGGEGCHEGDRQAPLQDCNDKQRSQLCEQVSNLEQRPARQEDKIASASLLSDRVVNFHEYPDLSTLRRAHVPREFGAAGARPLTCLYLLKLQKDLAVRAAIGRANPVAFCRRAISIASAGRMNCMSNDPGAKWLTDNVHVQA
jgi:hypothetical protein